MINVRGARHPLLALDDDGRVVGNALALQAGTGQAPPTAALPQGLLLTGSISPGQNYVGQMCNLVQRCEFR